MKRLLGLIGLTSYAVLTACFYILGDYALYLSIGAFVLFLIGLFIRKLREDKTYLTAFLTASLSALIFFLFTVNSVEPIMSKYAGVSADVKAVQSTETYTANGFYVYELEIKEINGESVDTRLLLLSKSTIYSEPFDTLEFSCELDKVTNRSYLSHKIFLRAALFGENEVKVTRPDHKPFWSFIYDLRNNIRRGLYMELDKDVADFSSAVLIGDKHSLSAEVTKLLRLNGLSHISVVSGLHLSIIISLCYKILSRLLKKKWIHIPLTIVIMFIYAAVTGMNMPVVRAMVMFTFLLFGKLIGRWHDPVNSIGAAALVILVSNPYGAGDIGMLLSFCATLGVVLWMDKISSFIWEKLSRFAFVTRFIIFSRIIRLMTDVFSTSVCAVVWTLPIAVLCFGGFSAVTVISNLLIVPFMTVVIAAMALCVSLHYIPFMSNGAYACGVIVTLFYRWMVFVCDSLSRIPYSYIDADAVHFKLWISATFILVAAALLLCTKRCYKLSALLSALVLLGGVFGYNLGHQNTVTLRIPYTNNGLSVILESVDGYALLTIGGSRTRIDSLCEYIASLGGGECDVLIDTAEAYSDMYYYGLTSAFDYQMILRYDSDGGIKEEGGNVRTFSSETSLSLWDKAEVLLIPINEDVFEYVTIGNTTLLILPEGGDVQLLSQKYTSPDIVITRGICRNMGLLSCDKLIVAGDDYKAYATSVLASPIADEVVTGTNIKYDIDIV